MDNHNVVLAYPKYDQPAQCFEVREPSPEYQSKKANRELTSLSDLQDALETHLAQYHYHQSALLAMATNPEGCDSSEWELGAHTLGYELQQYSDELIAKLSQAIWQSEHGSHEQKHPATRNTQDKTEKATGKESAHPKDQDG